MFRFSFCIRVTHLPVVMKMSRLLRRRSGLPSSCALLLLVNLLLKSQNAECFHRLLPSSSQIVTHISSSSCAAVSTTTSSPQPSHSFDGAGRARRRKRGRHHAVFRMAERGHGDGGDADDIMGAEKSAGVKLNKGWYTIG